MFISAIVSAYRVSAFLNDALLSAVSQANSHGYEVLVSTGDNELQIEQSILSRARACGVELRVVSMGRATYAESLVKAARIASGQVLALLDDDDLWHPGRIDRIERAFLSDSRIGYFHNNQRFIDAEGRPLKFWNPHRLLRHSSSLMREGREFVLDPRSRKEFGRASAFEPWFNNSSIAILRSTVLEAADELSRARGAEDTLLFSASAASSKWAYLTSDCLTDYRLHTSGVTAASSEHPGSPSDVELYLKFVRTRHLHLDQLIRSLLPPESPPHLEEWISRDHAFWQVMEKIGEANTSTPVTGHPIGKLIAQDPFPPTLRDVSAAALCFLSTIAPDVTRQLFLLSRRA
ncbi:MAG: glycosyltransferase [Nitrososphaerota archaeon]|jgi:hypothetical protein|nr:glycosyltransferase [Nitrososphaerota archaeon]